MKYPIPPLFSKRRLSPLQSVVLALSVATLAGLFLNAPALASDHPDCLKLDAEQELMLERQIKETQAALLRIFALDSETLPALALCVQARQKMKSRHEVTLSGAYRENTLFLSNDILKRATLTPLLKHELVHWIIDFLSNGRSPAWIDEGLAQLLSGPAPDLVKKTSRLRLAALSQLPLSSLEKHFVQKDEDSLLLSYSLARLAVESLILRRTLHGFLDYFDKLRSGYEHPEAFKEAFSISIEDFQRGIQQGFMLQAKQTTVDSRQP